jgi:AcrR family transcriptional regulator
MTLTEQSRRERKKDETRRRIFETAIELFRSKGFEATTVDDITERADVARGTFFNYFPKKEAVLAFLSEQRLVELEADASAVFSADRSAREKLLEVYDRAATAWEENREFSEYVLSELLRRAFTPVEEIGPRWDEVLVKIIQQGQQTGELKAGVDSRRAVEVMTSVYYSVIYVWVHCLEPAQLDLRSELRARLELVLDGLGAKEAAS